MGELLEILKPEIDATIERLTTRRFTPDPIAGKHFSKVVSVMSSAYKRHGYILERAILEQLKLCPDITAWEDMTFQVTNTADHIVDTAIAEPDKIFGTEAGYHDGHRTLQVDAITYNHKSKEIKAYEVKRGAGLHDAGKRRSILRDLLCLQILLKSYGQKKGLEISNAKSYIIFYYGKCSIKKPFCLIRDELDDHFGFPVYDAVEEVNQHFQSRLFQILSAA